MTLYEIISIIISIVAIGLAVFAMFKSVKTSRRQEAMMDRSQLQQDEAELARLEVEYKRVQNDHWNQKQNNRPKVFSIEAVSLWERNLDESYRAIYADYDRRIATLKQRIRELKTKLGCL